MTRKRILAAALICILGIIPTACGANQSGDEGGTGYSREIKTNKDQVEVDEIEICIAAENDNHVYNASYPKYMDVASASAHKMERKFFTVERPHVISREDFDYFYDYCKSIEDRAGTGKPFLYDITLRYYDENGELQHEFFYEYGDSFSEEFKELVARFNEMCGEEVFETPETPVELNPDFIYDNFGVTPDDYSPEEISAMIDKTHQSFGMFTALSRLTIDEHMDYYYSLLEEDKIEDHYATKALNSRQVSEEEWTDFADRFAQKLGDKWEVDNYGFGYGVDITLKNKETDESISITQGSYAVTHGTVVDGYLEIFIETGPEGMGFSDKVIYNKTGEYMIHSFIGVKNKAEIVKAFIEME